MSLETLLDEYGNPKEWTEIDYYLSGSYLKKAQIEIPTELIEYLFVSHSPYEIASLSGISGGENIDELRANAQVIQDHVSRYLLWEEWKASGVEVGELLSDKQKGIMVQFLRDNFGPAITNFQGILLYKLNAPHCDRLVYSFRERLTKFFPQAKPLFFNEEGHLLVGDGVIELLPEDL